MKIKSNETFYRCKEFLSFSNRNQTTLHDFKEYREAEEEFNFNYEHYKTAGEAYRKCYSCYLEAHRGDDSIVLKFFGCDLDIMGQSEVWVNSWLNE